MKLSTNGAVIYIVFAFCIISLGVYWFSRPASRHTSTRQDDRVKIHHQGHQPRSLSGSGSDASGQPGPSASAAAVLVKDEPAATRQMFVAHAPLRVPELADPDSKANREILQTMVLKALQRKAAEEPADTLDTPR
jgi:hypothetical protein